jgi:hypothetical protein
MREFPQLKWHLDEVFVQINEALWPTSSNRDGQTQVIRRGNESYWKHRATRNRSLAEQSSGEFPSSVPTMGTSHASFPADAKFKEIRISSRLRPQPFQPGTTPIQPEQIQDQPHCSFE